MIAIRPAQTSDQDDIWAILHPVFAAGRTYAIDPSINRTDALAYWTKAPHRAYVARKGAQTLGTYYIRANFEGNASHICNCGYITAPDAQGRGVARAMLAHSQDTARQLGFSAMQYNIVLANNIRAIDLWLHDGFCEIGRIPSAFLHPDDGMIDALILHKTLDHD